MLQAALFERLSFDPFSFQQDGLAASEVNVGRCEVAEAFVISQVIVVADEGVDLGFKIARQIVVIQQDTVLECLMPTFDLALGHRVIRCTANMIHALFFEPVGHITRDIA